MFEDKSILAIIPARGQSKRLARKNILNFIDKPLISWSIEAARKSCYIDEVIVSTEDQEIADVAQTYGASVPFLRPSVLAKDDSKSIDVVIHCIDYCKMELSKTYDYVVLLQPTSPLRNHLDIDDAIKYFFEKNAEAVISVHEIENHSFFTMNTLPADLSMKHFFYLKNEDACKEKYYKLNGAIYINAVNKLYKEKTFFIKDNIYAYVMPIEKSVDIDTYNDFKKAERYMLQQDRSLSCS